MRSIGVSRPARRRRRRLASACRSAVGDGEERELDSPSFDAAHDPFEEIYRRVGTDLDLVPWASLAPRAELVAWLDGPPSPGFPPATPALVVACGLGDDAEELAARGFEVVAFDLSPTAIELCRRRFPKSRVRYDVQDLLWLPGMWTAAFGLVVEVNTVQSLAPGDHGAGIAAIASTLAPGGRLFIRCTGRLETEPADHRPWPLTRRELGGYSAAGLVETSFVESRSPSQARQFIATYRRPR